MLIIPPQQLARETLVAIIEEYVSREGTDYGAIEISLTTKVEQVMGQLHSGEICLCYDDTTESCNLLPAEDAKALAGEVGEL